MLPSLNIIIEATTDGLTRGIDEAQGKLRRFGTSTQSVAQRMDRLGTSLNRVGARMSIVSGAMAAGAAAAFGLAQSTALVGDEIAKTARGAGISAGALQEYRFALGQVAGASRGEVDAALSRLNRTIGEAADGMTPAIEALEQLGFSAEEIASGVITTEEAMGRFINVMNEADSAAKAASLSSDLMGRAGAELGPKVIGAAATISALRQQANDLGGVLDGDALAASENFNDAMDRVQTAVAGLKNQIGAALLPVLVNTLIPAIEEKVIPGLASMVQGVVKVIDWFGDLPEPIKEAAAVIATTLGAGGPILLALGVMSKAFSLIIASTGPIGLFIAAATLAYAAWQTWGDDIKAAIGGALDWVGEKFDWIVGKIQDFVQSIKDAAQSVKDFFASLPGMLPQGGGGVVSGAITPEVLSQQGLSEGQIGEIMDADPRERGAMLGRMVGTGFQEGLTSTLDANSEAIRLYLQQIEQEARDQLEIKSPSRVFANIGNEIGAGLAMGIDESTALVQSALDGMIGSAVGNVKGGVKDILSGLGNLFQGSKEISAGIALANSFLAFTEVLKDPAFVGNPFGRFAAASAALSSGLAAVQSIKSAQKGGTSAGSSGGASGAGSAPALPRQNIVIDLVGDTFSRGSVQEVFDVINDGLRRGYQIDGVLVQ
jgi:hypothetical protein